MEYIKDVDTNVNKIMKDITKPELVKGLLHLILAVYIARLAPPLPSFMIPLLGNQYFKLLIFSLILWTAQFSPSTSILISISFVIALNLANNKPAWEFLENTVSTSKTENVLSSQIANTPVVSGVQRSGDSIVITPKIVNTVNGPKVVTPNVIISPAVVSDSTGQKVLVNPNVSSVNLSPSLTNAIKPIPQSIDAVKTLSVLASSPSPANPQAVASVVNTAMKAVTTDAGSKAVVDLANQAIAPSAGVSTEIKKNVEVAIKNIVDTKPPTSVAPVAPVAPGAPVAPVAPVAGAAQAAVKKEGCYPLRKYDVSKITGYTVNNLGDHGDWKQGPNPSLT